MISTRVRHYVRQSSQRRRAQNCEKPYVHVAREPCGGGDLHYYGSAAGGGEVCGGAAGGGGVCGAAAGGGVVRGRRPGSDGYGRLAVRFDTMGGGSARRPRVPSHNSVRRELRQRARTMVVGKGVDSAETKGSTPTPYKSLPPSQTNHCGDGRNGSADAGASEVGTEDDDPIARRLAEFHSLADKASLNHLADGTTRLHDSTTRAVTDGTAQSPHPVRRNGAKVQVHQPSRKQRAVPVIRTSIQTEVRLERRQQTRPPPILPTAQLSDPEPEEASELKLEQQEMEPAWEPDPQLEPEIAAIRIQAIHRGRRARRHAAALLRMTDDTESDPAQRHPERNLEADQQIHSPTALTAELARLDAIEKERLEKNLLFLEDTERSRLHEENRILEKSNTWHERQSSVESQHGTGTKAEPVASLSTKSSVPQQPSSSPGGWVETHGTPRAVRTDALAAGLAAEQQRVTALEKELAHMRTAWEEERVMAAAERAALEEALAALNGDDTTDATILAAHGAQRGSDDKNRSETLSLVDEVPQVGVDGMDAMPQHMAPVPPAKRPHARTGRSCRRPSSARAATRARPPSSSRPGKRLVTSARQRRDSVVARTIGAPHHPKDVARSDNARTMLEEWVRADEHARTARRELSPNPPVDESCATVPYADAVDASKDADVMQCCARRRSYRRLCVKLVQALNADALSALRRCERERAIKLLLEARLVLANGCFGKTPAAELQQRAPCTSKEASEEDKAINPRMDDGRNLCEWVRLHSSTLNNLGIAHRDRTRASKNGSRDAKSARALAKVNADAQAVLKESARLKSNQVTDPADPGIKLALRFIDRARALEHEALRVLGHNFSGVDSIAKPVAGRKAKRARKSRKQLPKQKATDKHVKWSMDSGPEEPRPDPTMLGTSDAVALIRGHVPPSKSKVIGGDDNDELGTEFAKTLMNVYGIGPVQTVPLQRNTNYHSHPDLIVSPGIDTGRDRETVAATVVVPVNLDASGNCCPGSAYAQNVSGRRGSEKSLAESTRKQRVGWEATIPPAYRADNLNSIRRKPKIGQADLTKQKAKEATSPADQKANLGQTGTAVRPIDSSICCVLPARAYGNRLRSGCLGCNAATERATSSIDSQRVCRHDN